MVCYNYTDGFHTEEIKIQKPEISDLDMFYGDDFSLIHKGLVDILQEKNSTGLTLFHGPAGTGKTNYLRYLINEIQGKKFLFIPPDLMNVNLYQENLSLLDMK